MTLIRRILVLALLVLGIVLVAAAALLPTVVRDAAVQIPTDFEKRNVLSGTGQLLDRSSMAEAGPIRVEEGLPLEITATTVAESVTPDGNLLVRTSSVGNKVGVPPASAQFHSANDVVAIDRRERTVVTDPAPTIQSPATVPARPAPARAGTYFTFPADTPRADLPYFDTATQTPVTARYVSDDRLVDGLETLHFHFEVIGHDMAESPAVGQPTRLTLPARKWGLEGDAPLTMNLYYTMVQDIWVEPVSGTVVDSALRPRSYFAQSPQDPQQIVVYAGEMRFTPETVASLAQTARDGRGMIQVVFFWLPIGAGIAGVVLLAVSVLLIVRGRRRADKTTGGSGSSGTRETERSDESGDESPEAVATRN